jgi:hypothetical protein
MKGKIKAYSLPIKNQILGERTIKAMCVEQAANTFLWNKTDIRLVTSRRSVFPNKRRVIIFIPNDPTMSF